METLMKFTTAYLWETGGRMVNEDSLTVFGATKAGRDYLLAAVADGIGGLCSGEIASGHITYRLKLDFEMAISRHSVIDSDKLLRIILRELYSCHKDLLKLGKLNNTSYGTTVSALIVKDRRAYCISIGDSRIYRYNRFLHKIVQIGRNHVDHRGRLTRCIGSGAFRRIKVRRLTLHRGDTFLIATDGFYRNITPQLNRLCEEAHNDTDGLALKLGKIYRTKCSMENKDNASAILVRFGR